MSELSRLRGSERYAACADDEPRFPLPFSMPAPLAPTIEAALKKRAVGAINRKKAAATADGALFYVQICAILYQNS